VDPETPEPPPVEIPPGALEPSAPPPAEPLEAPLCPPEPEEDSGPDAEPLPALFDVAELFEYGALLLFEPDVHGKAPHAPTDNATASAIGAARRIRAVVFVFTVIPLRIECFS
jgi:hypothetical protein